MTLLSVLIPVYNEAPTIKELLRRVVAAELPHNVGRELVVVNDSSTDGTDALIRSFIQENPTVNLQYHIQTVNQGKGAAVRKAIELATGDYVVVQDADLEYDPGEYAVLLRPVLDGHADAVYGSRFISGSPHRILFFWHSIGNRFLTTLSNAFTDLNLTDMETCYKLIRTDVAKGLKLRENRFGIEPELTAKLSRVKGIRIYEVGISYYGRTYDDGKKIGWKDGIRAIWCILKYNIWSR